jgi:hypothetical protein
VAPSPSSAPDDQGTPDPGPIEFNLGPARVPSADVSIPSATSSDGRGWVLSSSS